MIAQRTYDVSIISSLGRGSLPDIITQIEESENLEVVPQNHQNNVFTNQDMGYTRQILVAYCSLASSQREDSAA